MKSALSLSVAACVLGLLAPSLLAQNPASRRSPSYYGRMWQNSPFTEPVKTTDKGATEAISPLDDWSLSGFAEIANKKVVILQSKRNQGDRVMVISGEPNNKNIEILEIQRGEGYLQDRVKLRLGGSVEGWVSYDPKFLKITRQNTPAPGPENKNGPAKPAK